MMNPNKIYKEYIIYQIVNLSKKTTDSYVGSTCNLSRRASRHKFESKSNNSRFYKTVREYGGWSCWSMIVLRKLYDVKRKDAILVEEQIREALQAKLNTNICCRGDMTVAEYMVKYRKQNAEKNKEYQKQYRLNNPYKAYEKYKNLIIKCDCGSTFLYFNKCNHLKSIKHATYLQNL